MVRIAIPIFQNRISPVLDSCKRLLIVDAEHSREVERTEVGLDDLSLTDRFRIIRNLDADVIICCAISDVMETLLKSTRVRLISGIVGEAELVIGAFFDDRLDEPRFHMPGDRAHR
jgi:predicted Fe-Mo cluster-binding NifX family protein